MAARELDSEDFRESGREHSTGPAINSRRPKHFSSLRSQFCAAAMLFAVGLALLPTIALAYSCGTSCISEAQDEQPQYSGHYTGVAVTRYDNTLYTMTTNSDCAVEFMSHPKVWETQYVEMNGGASAVELATLHKYCADCQYCTPYEHRWWVYSYFPPGGFQQQISPATPGVGFAQHRFSLYKTGTYHWNYTVDSTIKAQGDLNSWSGAGYQAAVRLESYDDAMTTAACDSALSLSTQQNGTNWIVWVPVGSVSGWISSPSPPMSGQYSDASDGCYRQG